MRSWCSTEMQRRKQKHRWRTLRCMERRTYTVYGGGSRKMQVVSTLHLHQLSTTAKRERNTCHDMSIFIPKRRSGGDAAPLPVSLQMSRKDGRTDGAPLRCEDMQGTLRTPRALRSPRVATNARVNEWTAPRLSRTHREAEAGRFCLSSRPQRAQRCCPSIWLVKVILQHPVRPAPCSAPCSASDWLSAPTWSVTWWCVCNEGRRLG